MSAFRQALQKSLRQVPKPVEGPSLTAQRKLLCFSVSVSIMLINCKLNESSIALCALSMMFFEQMSVVRNQAYKVGNEFFSI